MRVLNYGSGCKSCFKWRWKGKEGKGAQTVCNAQSLKRMDESAGHSRVFLPSIHPSISLPFSLPFTAEWHRDEQRSRGAAKRQLSHTSPCVNARSARKKGKGGGVRGGKPSQIMKEKPRGEGWGQGGSGRVSGVSYEDQ